MFLVVGYLYLLLSGTRIEGMNQSIGDVCFVCNFACVLAVYGVWPSSRVRALLSASRFAGR